MRRIVPDERAIPALAHFLATKPKNRNEFSHRLRSAAKPQPQWGAWAGRRLVTRTLRCGQEAIRHKRPPSRKRAPSLYFRLLLDLRSDVLKEGNCHFSQGKVLLHFPARELAKPKFGKARRGMLSFDLP